MADDELIDYWDEGGAWQGVAPRHEVHANGLWHRTLHLWLVTPEEGGSLVYQLRSNGAASWPGFLDASVAGHLLAGERYRDALRESGEEIGVEVPARDVIALGERRIEDLDPKGGRNREIQGVCIVRCDCLWNNFRPVDGEAAGLCRIGHNAGERLFEGRAACIPCDMLLVGEEGIFAERRDVTLDDFVPRPAPYYITMHDIARRLIEGEAGDVLVEAFNRGC